MSQPRTLDVGCGINKSPGAIGIDRNPDSHADVLCDLRSRSGAKWRIMSIVTDLAVVHAGWVATALDSVLLVSPGSGQKLR